jgi:hypothetical protein
MNKAACSLKSSFAHLLIGICLLPILGLSSPCLAGMRWSARAIDPSLIDALRSDSKLLDATLFGEMPEALTEKLEKSGVVEIEKPTMEDMAKRRAEVGDTEVDLDKAWHGIHYLLTGSAVPDESLASKVIWGGADIGPNLGYGPARLLKPDEVKAIAQLLAATTPDNLRKRYKPKEMTNAVYPDVWEREGEDALKWVVDNYIKLVAFYKRAAERGQAVILAIS